MVSHHHIHLNGFSIGNDLPIFIIAGPCALQDLDHALFMSESLKRITDDLGIGFIYKTSFDKANRTSAHAVRGVGLEAALPIFSKIKEKIGCPVLTDVHTAAQCEALAGVVDVLQIPAFLCRQTDLLLAAAKTGLVVNIKKGQFLAPWDMANVVDKMSHGGSENIMLCERGVSFGYNTLVNDFRALPIMAETGKPIIFDATHSVQQPGGRGTSSGGDRRFVSYLARAAVAVGVAGLFMETHEDPDSAPSDGANMVFLSDFSNLLLGLRDLDNFVKGGIL